MIFNIILFITASLYWYVTGHMAAAIIGYIVLLLYMQRYSFIAIVLSAAAMISVIYYYWVDQFSADTVSLIYNSIGVIYLFVLYIKAKKLFENDDISLD